ncbi:ATP-dependent Clp protease proteolytic subunit [Rhodococcus sp. H29-C3]|uniref:ClpP family protease n=1 Tax=Rhodococcus sp. H29-C3 TaxID=3046307 RepID=UPI0032D59F4D
MSCAWCRELSTLALGLACSAGQFLLSSGTHGKRYDLPHARILMHQGSAGIGDSAVAVEVQANDLRQTRDSARSDRTQTGVLHQPAAQGCSTIPDLILAADEVVRVRSGMEAILSEHTGRDVATLRHDTGRGLVLTASAALDYGIVDQVLKNR